MTINKLVKEAHENAVNHGFWDKPPEFGTSIALIHSELSEALEERRKNILDEAYQRCVYAGRDWTEDEMQKALEEGDMKK